MTRYEEVVQQVSTRFDDECWIWSGSLRGKGYGALRRKGKVVNASTAAYELRYGPTPTGKVLDHLCETKACWNPDHLEPVTNAENVSRGLNAGGSKTKTHCKRGHSYDNAYWYEGPNGRWWRGCRTCRRERTREYRQRLKGEYSAVD